MQNDNLKKIAHYEKKIDELVELGRSATRRADWHRAEAIALRVKALGKDLAILRTLDLSKDW